LKDVFKILIGAGVAVAVVAIVVIMMVQIQADEKIAKQQHPCYQLYFQLQELRDEMIEIERLNRDLVGELQELTNKWVSQNRCGETLEEWADEKIIAEIGTFSSSLKANP